MKTSVMSMLSLRISLVYEIYSNKYFSLCLFVCVCLGKGSFGSVKEAYLLANPQKRFAVKSISKSSEAAEEGSFEWLYREVRISK